LASSFRQERGFSQGFTLWIVDPKIPFSFFLELAFIDKPYLHAVRHIILLSLRTSDRGWPWCGRFGNRLPFESPSINNFSGIDISQSLDQEPSSLSPHFLLHLWMAVSLQLKQFKTWLRKVKGIMVGQLYLRLYLFYQAEIFPDYKTRRPLLPSLIILNLSDHMTRQVIILLKFSKSANWWRISLVLINKWAFSMQFKLSTLLRLEWASLISVLEEINDLIWS